jgi:signal transduction histidine kinase/CheY-like chemotaxis protein
MDINYESLFNEAPNPYLILDSSLKIVAANQAYLSATMAERDTLLGQYLFDAFPANPEELNANGVSNLQASMEDVLKYRKANTMAVQKYDIPKRDGEIGFEERFWCSVNSPVFGEDDEVAFIIHNAQDVTAFMQGRSEQKAGAPLKGKTARLETQIYRSAQELQEANKKLKVANEAKSTFLASMSHELRTPLNAILGFTQILERDSTLDKEQREEVKIISRMGQHLLGLINNILDIAKIEAVEVQLQEKSFDLYDFFRDLGEMFRDRAVEKGLSFKMKKTDNLPQYIKADEVKLRQIVINLLGNSLKFTRKGDITIRLWADKNIQKLHCEIEDTGIGISPEYIKKVFDPFVQSSASVDNTTGTGLGLAITQQFIKGMGGDIEVESTVNKGSLFRFHIKMNKAEISHIEDTAPVKRAIGIAPGQPIQRILVVEDIFESRKLLVKLLKTIGFEVQEAVNGKQGLEIFNSWQPNLIWMDMRMPVMDGYEATKQIKKTQAGQQTIVIALTAHAFEDERQKILDIGCDDFIKKPYLIEEIFTAITKHLGVRFLYEDIKNSPLDVLTNKTLPELPEAIKKKLLAAATLLDQETCFTILEQLHSTHPEAASELRVLIENYNFEELERIIGR